MERAAFGRSFFVRVKGVGGADVGRIRAYSGGGIGLLLRFGNEWGYGLSQRQAVLLLRRRRPVWLRR